MPQNSSSPPGFRPPPLLEKHSFDLSAHAVAHRNSRDLYLSLSFAGNLDERGGGGMRSPHSLTLSFESSPDYYMRRDSQHALGIPFQAFHVVTDTSCTKLIAPGGLATGGTRLTRRNQILASPSPRHWCTIVSLFQHRRGPRCSFPFGIDAWADGIVTGCRSCANILSVWSQVVVHQLVRQRCHACRPLITRNLGSIERKNRVGRGWKLFPMFVPTGRICSSPCLPS